MDFYRSWIGKQNYQYHSFPLITWQKAVFILFLFILSGCVPAIHPPGSATTSPFVATHYFKTEDGAILPLRQWLPETDPVAVIIAVHGFNDYSHFFDRPGKYLRKYGIASFAYDQRGFGGSPKTGTWAGVSAYSNDLAIFAKLMTHRYQGRPIYILGESMGGAIVINALKNHISGVRGSILVAPAVWARETMPWYQTSLLWLLAHTMPGLTLTGESVGVTPSDNIDMLRELGRDPFVIKATRVETVNGLTDLMDAAYESANTLGVKSLILYGDKDEIIPKEPTYQFLRNLLSNSGDNKTIAFYQNGYHMLLRDLKAEIALNDIVAWIKAGAARSPLPSGADKHASEKLRTGS